MNIINERDTVRILSHKQYLEYIEAGNVDLTKYQKSKPRFGAKAKVVKISNGFIKLKSISVTSNLLCNWSFSYEEGMLELLEVAE